MNNCWLGLTTVVICWPTQCHNAMFHDQNVDVHRTINSVFALLCRWAVL